MPNAGTAAPADVSSRTCRQWVVLRRLRAIRRERSAPLWWATVAVLLFLHVAAVSADELRVMTSGAFTAAYLELAPVFERATGHRMITLSTSSTGPTGVNARLERGDAVDVVIVSDGDLE